MPRVREIPLEGPTAEDQLVDHQLRHRLARIVSAIDPVSRDVLIRRDVLGEPAAEVADVSLMPYLAGAQLAGAAAAIADLRHVQRWWAEVSARPSWQRVSAH